MCNKTLQPVFLLASVGPKAAFLYGILILQFLIKVFSLSKLLKKRIRFYMVSSSRPVIIF